MLKSSSHDSVYEQHSYCHIVDLVELRVQCLYGGGVCETAAASTERLAGERVRRQAILKDESVKKCISEYAGV